MTAVVRPVCIYHSDLGNGRIALFLVAEIILTELDIIVVHSETELVHKSVKSERIEVDETFKLLDSGGNIVICIESLYGIE